MISVAPGLLCFALDARRFCRDVETVPRALEVRRERPRVSTRGKVPPVQTLAGPDGSAP